MYLLTKQIDHKHPVADYEKALSVTKTNKSGWKKCPNDIIYPLQSIPQSLTLLPSIMILWSNNLFVNV